MYEMRALNFAATKFIPLCEGISGTIGTLVVDGDYEEDPDAFPIDALVVDLFKIDDEESKENASIRGHLRNPRILVPVPGLWYLLYRYGFLRYG
jgi:hypothetical protein